LGLILVLSVESTILRLGLLLHDHQVRGVNKRKLIELSKPAASGNAWAAV